MQSCKIKKGRQLHFNRLQCNHKLLFLKGGNSNLIDCNAITQNKKGRQLQALQSIKLELPPFFYFAQLHSNLLNWDYLPFLLFFVIGLQSIKLELSPFFICS